MEPVETSTLPAVIIPRTSDVPAIAGTDLVEVWLAGRKASTIRGYRCDVDHFCRFFGGNLDGFFGCAPGTANGIVLAYRADQIGQGLASATIARRLSAVRSFVKLARTLGRITWEIEVEAPKHEDRRDMSGPDDHARKAIMKALKKSGDSTNARRDRVIYHLLFTMGIRRGELVALDLADVDFVESTLSILGKGRREKERRPVPENAMRSLREWVTDRGQHDGPLFTRLDRPGSTERLTGYSVLRALKKLGVTAKLAKPLRCHGLRHAAITKLLSSGETIRDVMAFSRHKNPQTLMRYDDSKDLAAKRVTSKVDKELA